MPKPKVLSGKKVVAILKKFGFEVLSQRGSHIKVFREVGGGRQVLTIPNHTEIDKGTVVGIVRQTSRFVAESELRKEFYTN